MQTFRRDGLYVISVTARLVGLHVNTLRKYEREGLLAPTRTEGNIRLYSGRDIERLRQIKRLVDDRGMNLAGVQMALALADKIGDLQNVLDQVPDPTRAHVQAALDDVLDVLRCTARPTANRPVSDRGHPT